MKIILNCLGAGFLLAAASCSHAALASSYSVPSTNGWNEYGGSSFMVGYDFTPTVNLSVSSLGILDWFADGLVSPSQVGIWNGSGTLLTSVVLPAGKLNPEPAGATSTEFYFAPVAPLLLSAGTTYRIGSQMTGGLTEVVGYDGVFTPASDILFGLGWANHGTTFGQPGEFSNPTPYMGPAFQYSVATIIPEPGAGALLLMGAGLLGSGGRRGRTARK